MTDQSQHDLVIVEAQTERLRGIALSLGELDVGVALLHLDAGIAALESRMAKARSGERPIHRVVLSDGLRPTEEAST